jgi:LAS superfamily LD-carboxypeptidase LdcB
VFGSSVGKVGGYGSMPVPAELQVYPNGQLPDAELQSIGQGPHRLWAPAAQGWKAAVAAARADGIDLRVTDSYRTYAEQVDLAQRKGLYADGGLAAVPGTSNHGWGLAVDADITNPATMSWLRSNGYKYGFVEAVSREPWHWEFRPNQA